MVVSDIHSKGKFRLCGYRSAAVRVNLLEIIIASSLHQGERPQGLGVWLGPSLFTCGLSSFFLSLLQQIAATELQLKDSHQHVGSINVRDSYKMQI